MAETPTAGRTYRLSPPDRTGWMLGLSLGQLAMTASGIVAGTLLMIVVSVSVGFVAMALFIALCVVRVQGASLLELAPQSVRYIGLRRAKNTTWYAAVPVISGNNAAAPNALAALELLDIDAVEFNAGRLGARIAVSHDKTGGTVAATIRVSGRRFGLVDRPAQDWLVNQWGSALQAFVNETCLVRSVRWSEWAAPAGLDEHRHWIAGQRANEPVDHAVTSYQQLLSNASNHVVRHDVLVTLTVNVGTTRGRSEQERLRGAIEALLRELRLFQSRLADAQLVASDLLSPTEWARAMRLRLDPSCRLALDTRQRALDELAGACTPTNAGPLAAKSHWTAWQTDNSWHRALYVADWPRLDVPAAWLTELMLYATAVRTVCVIFEPIPSSRSQRSIRRDAAKIESDAAHRAEKGFRVGAHHRRARQAVDEREEELVAGYREFSYAGLITVTAPTLDALDQHTAELTQIAASIGIELRALHGRHDLAMVATLPVARSLKPKRLL